MPITRRRRANPPEQPENNNNNNNHHTVEQPEEQNVEASAQAPEQLPQAQLEEGGSALEAQSATATPPPTPLTPLAPPTPTNGVEAQGYTPTIESGRRTSRGELFRRPPQVPHPSAPQAPPSAGGQPQPAAPLQAASHEISLPLGNLLHLAYNPGYTGSEEARSSLLAQLSEESKAGGRARCWNCGALAVAYDRWSTRSKTFGEVGIAFCEICGVWSVL
jgi:hypothetical protein